MFAAARWMVRRLRRHTRPWDRRPLRRAFGPVGMVVLSLLPVGWSLRQVATIRRLRSASSRATDDASAKAIFLRLASHEIRTPLTLARGQVDIIRGATLGPVNPRMEDALSSVEQKLAQIEELVVQMVETARMDPSEPGIRLAPLDMREVVEEAVRRVAEQFGPGHEILVSVTAQPSMVMGERIRLRAVLVNMLSNATKYSSEGEEVRCTLRQRGRRVEVAVADRGIGIEPADIQRMFQPFTRLAEGMQVAPSGLGLGLHVARTIAEAHGGTLTAAANPGGGSVFNLSLPRAG